MSSGGTTLGRAPVRLVGLAAVAAIFLLVPLIALLAAAPWSQLGEILGASEVRQALWLSAYTSAIAALLCILLGTPLAWLLARVEFPGRGTLRALVIVPLVLPPVVAGVALLTALGRTGLIGGPLREAFGIQIPYTMAAVVIAHAFVAMPFYVLTVEAAFRAVPESLEVASATLGASRWTTFLRVSLPLARPGLIAGTVLAWARSLGEFGATITFAGNYPGTTRTLPLEVYTKLQDNRDLAVAVSLLLLGLCVLVLAGLRERWLGFR